MTLQELEPDWLILKHRRLLGVVVVVLAACAFVLPDGRFFDRRTHEHRHVFLGSVLEIVVLLVELLVVNRVVFVFLLRLLLKVVLIII